MSFLIAQKCIYLRDKMSKKPTLPVVSTVALCHLIKKTN